MIKVFTSPNAAVVKMAADILAQHEVGAVIRNDRISSVVGEIPWTEAWPELWVLDERLAERAHELLLHFDHPDANAADSEPGWDCPGCGEFLEGQFSACWACGTPRPGN